MNWNTLIDPTVSGRLCLTLLHSVWQVALLAIVAWGVGRFWKKRSIESRYVANVMALLAAFVAMPITFVLLDDNKEAGTPVVDNSVAVNVAESEPITVMAAPPIAETITPEPILEIDLHADSSEPEEFMATSPPLVVQVAEDPSPGWLRLAPWIVAFYSTGVVLMLVRLMVAILKQNRLGTRAEPITDGPLLETLQRLAHTWSMRVVPTLARAEQIAVPIVVGIVRPTILLPTSAISGLTTDELEMILTHELAHVRRHDMWINLLQRVAEAVLFFNPALWYLSRRISTLREYCCDEMACRAQPSADLEPRIRYATALLRVVELARPNAIPTNDLAALAASGRSISELRRRVSRLLGEPLREPLRISRGGVFVVAATVFLLFAGPVFWKAHTQSLGKEKQVEEEVTSKTETTGVVKNAAGRPAVEAKLRLIFEADAHSKTDRIGNRGEGLLGKVLATTDEQGRFEMDQLTPGVRYAFNVKTRDGTQVIVKDLRAGQQNVQIVVPPRRDLIVKIKGEMNQLYLRSGRPFIRVRQRVSYQMPDGSTYRDVMGADVQFFSLNGEDAQATFRGLPIDLKAGEERQQVEVTLGNDRSTTKTVDVNKIGITVVEFDLPDAKKGPILRGRLTDESGSGLPGVVVTLFGKYGGPYVWKTPSRGQETTTDANGEYVFHPLVTGVVRASSSIGNLAKSFNTGVMFNHTAYVPVDGKSWRIISMPFVDGREEVFDLKLTRGGKVSGVVVGKISGNPLPKLNLRIDADDDNRTSTARVTTDDKGRFTSPALFPGKYVIVINDQVQTYSEIGRITVRAGVTSDMSLAVDDAVEISPKAIPGDSKQSLLAMDNLSVRVELSNQQGEPDDADIVSISNGRGMTDELLERISKLPKLGELKFRSATAVTERGWAHLSRMKRLKKFTLGFDLNNDKDSGLADVAIRAISKVRSLRELHTSESGITDAGVKSLESLSQLTHLSLHHENQLTDAALTSVAKLTQLKQLDLSNSYSSSKPFSEAGMMQLASLQNLEVLDARGQPVTSRVLVFPRLTSLSLSGGKVDNATATQIAKCRNLKGLNLMYTWITDVGLSQIATIPTLKHLDIDSHYITDAGIGQLTRLLELDHISLRASRVSDDSLEHLSQIKSLTRIDLEASGHGGVNSGKLFSSDGLRHLRVLPKLQSLRLSNFGLPVARGLTELKQVSSIDMMMVNISDEELDDLGIALPNTMIIAMDGARTRSIGGVFDDGGTRWQSGLKE